jgi:hypothetical protein
MNEIYKTAEEKLKELQKQLDEFESLKSGDDMNDIDMMKLEDYIANWEFIFNHGTISQKRNLILSIVSEVQVTEGETILTLEMDIPKFFEEISAIKETAKEEIAVSLEALDNKEVVAFTPSLQSVSSRGANSSYNTGMEAFKKKLNKAFNDKLKSKMTIGA